MEKTVGKICQKRRKTSTIEEDMKRFGLEMSDVNIKDCFEIKQNRYNYLWDVVRDNLKYIAKMNKYQDDEANSLEFAPSEKSSQWGGKTFSTGSVSPQNEEEEAKRHKCWIDPDSTFKHFWDGIANLFLLVSVVIIPLK